MAAIAVTLSELKKALAGQGFGVYRTLPTSIALVERVRENLILDSGIRVALEAGEPEQFVVRVIFRAEGRGFPGESEDQMLARAHALADQAKAASFSQVAAAVVPQMDPSHPGVELERFYEVTCEHAAPSIEAAGSLVRAAFAWLRSVPAA